MFSIQKKIFFLVFIFYFFPKIKILLLKKTLSVKNCSIQTKFFLLRKVFSVQRQLLSFKAKEARKKFYLMQSETLLIQREFSRFNESSFGSKKLYLLERMFRFDGI